LREAMAAEYGAQPGTQHTARTRRIAEIWAADALVNRR